MVKEGERKQDCVGVSGGGRRGGGRRGAQQRRVRRHLRANRRRRFRSIKQTKESQFWGVVVSPPCSAAGKARAQNQAPPLTAAPRRASRSRTCS